MTSAVLSRATDWYRYTTRLSRIAAHALRMLAPRSDPSDQWPVHACARASELFCKYVLQHRLVQAQVGHQSLELIVLFFELPQSAQLRWAQAAVPLASLVERRIADAQLAADLIDLRAQLHLLEGIGNLLLSDSALLHNMIPFSISEKSCRIFYF